jgi:hypothetical protein
MKTASITVERNFHIMNDDRFIMEKISATIELEEGDRGYEHTVINVARKMVEDNFKAAYPKVEEHLNFHVERQYSLKENYPLGINPNLNNHGEIQPTDIAKNYIAQKINKGTIEEQIEACTEIELPNGLKSFEMIANINPHLKACYNNKMKLIVNQQKREEKNKLQTNLT